MLEGLKNIGEFLSFVAIITATFGIIIPNSPEKGNETDKRVLNASKITFASSFLILILLLIYVKCMHPFLCMISYVSVFLLVLALFFFYSYWNIKPIVMPNEKTREKNIDNHFEKGLLS